MSVTRTSQTYPHVLLTLAMMGMLHPPIMGVNYSR